MWTEDYLAPLAPTLSENIEVRFNQFIKMLEEEYGIDSWATTKCKKYRCHLELLKKVKMWF